MGRIFTTSDTHGCLAQLESCFEQAGFDNEQDTLIHIGDLVDRGPDSAGVIERLLQIKNCIPIQGNHDQWFTEWLTKGQHPGWWLHGGRATLESYGKFCGRDVGIYQRNGAYDTDLNNTDIPIEHINFFKNQLPYYVDSQNRLFVHGGYDPNKLIDDQPTWYMCWDRDLVYKLIHRLELVDEVPPYTDVNKFSRVFVGHTPTINFKKKENPLGPEWKPTGAVWDTPMYLGQLVIVDTGGCFGGKISLLDITDDANHILYQA